MLGLFCHRVDWWPVQGCEGSLRDSMSHCHPCPSSWSVSRVVRFDSVKLKTEQSEQKRFGREGKSSSGRKRKRSESGSRHLHPVSSCMAAISSSWSINEALLPMIVRKWPEKKGGQRRLRRKQTGLDSMWVTRMRGPRDSATSLLLLSTNFFHSLPFNIPFILPSSSLHPFHSKSTVFFLPFQVYSFFFPSTPSLVSSSSLPSRMYILSIPLPSNWEFHSILLLFLMCIQAKLILYTFSYHTACLDWKWRDSFK